MRTFLFILLLALPIAAGASTVDDSDTAGIYYLHIRVDEEVKTEYSVNDKDKQFLSGMSSSIAMPEYLLDSIRNKVVEYVSDYLDMPVKLSYKHRKNGKRVETIGTADELEGMPTNTFKGAVKEEELHRYVHIWINITGGGKTTVSFGTHSHSKVKPKVEVKIKVLDKDKNKIAKEKAVLDDFGELKQKTRKSGSVTEKEAETLSPQDIYNMIIEGLEAALGDEE